MITLDDCPKTLAVCPAPRGNLRLLKRPPAEGNARYSATLREVADRIDADPDACAGVAVAVAWERGMVGRAWDGDYTRLIAATAVLGDSIMAAYNR